MLFDNHKVSNDIKNGQVTLIDLSAVLHTCALGMFGSEDYVKLENGKNSIDIDKFRPGLVGSLNYYAHLHGKADKVVLCVDKPRYWRKDFIDYKCTRKMKREESDFDMGSIHRHAETILEEIKKYVPWYVMDVPSMEADDSIAVIAKRLAVNNQVTIIAADSDLVQLQTSPNIRQWNPQLKKWVKAKDTPELDLMDKIIRGDSKDAVPNIYTDKEFFTRKVNGMVERQKPVSAKFINEAYQADFNPEVFCTTSDMVANFHRNQLLLDFNFIPKELQDACSELYDNYNLPKKSQLMSYMIKYKMNTLAERLSTF